MTDNELAGKQIMKSSEDSKSESTSDFIFNDVLNRLNDAEAKKEQLIREELTKNYNDWAYHIELLKEQFGEVWDLFGKIEDKVEGWYKGTSSYGQWGFMGASLYGYNFGASIHYSPNKKPIMNHSHAIGGSKVLSVSFACSFTDKAGNGAGDERKIGRKSKLDHQLIGLENCKGITLSQQLEGSKYILENLNGHNLELVVYNDKFGICEKSGDINSLYENKLKDICQQLFIKLNQDEVINLPQYLTAPKP